MHRLNPISFFLFFSLAVLFFSCKPAINNNLPVENDSMVTEHTVKAPVSLWTAMPPNAWKEMDTTQIRYIKYKLFSLDSVQMQQLLVLSPKEKNKKIKAMENILELPKPDSGFMKFRIHSTSVMDSALEAKFPSMKTYGGQGIEDPTAMVRLDFNQNGFHAYVISQDGDWLIQPAAKGITHQVLICFFKQDAIIPNRSPFELPDSLRK